MRCNKPDDDVAQGRVASPPDDKSESQFFWQEEYGVFSFDKKRLPNFVAYVENQKAHHAQNKTILVLERVDEVIQSMKESIELYEFEQESWRHEIESIMI